MSIAPHHAEWLSLLEIFGPFLSLVQLGLNPSVVFRSPGIARSRPDAPSTRIYRSSPSKNRHNNCFLTQLRQSQADYRRQGWNTVRTIHSMPLLVVEYCLAMMLDPDQAPQSAYYAARYYAERYDPRCADGLTPESAPLLKDIARFWYDYYGLDY